MPQLCKVPRLLGKFTNMVLGIARTTSINETMA